MKNQVKNNILNRIFHKKAVNENLQRKHECERLIVLENDLIDRIGTVSFDSKDVNSAKVTGTQSLPELLSIHKEAWTKGFRNQNIGPCEYGMFRTKDIATMQPNEVFLGDIYGLFTKSIPFWEDEKHNTKCGGGWPIYDYLTPYQIVLDQYKCILVSNIKAIADQAKKELDELFSLGY